MKLALKIATVLFLMVLSPLSGQKISDDSLMQKARIEIYDNPDNAINICKTLFKKEKNINNQISILLLISTANIAKRDFDQSLQYIVKAKELALQTNDLKTQIKVLISAAVQYQQMELYSKSLETLNEVETYIAKLPDEAPEKHTESGRSYAIRGMIYKSQSNPEIALEKLLISIRHFEKVTAREGTYANISVVYYNIGYCYLKLNQLEKAHQAFLQSMDFAKKNQAKSLEAFALKGMAEVYKQKRENETALKLLIQAEDLCKNTGDLTLNEGIYKEMAENYLALGQTAFYQKYNKKYFEMRFQRAQNELKSINHAINNHNRETLMKSRELTSHFRVLTAVIVGVSLLIIGVLLFFIIKVRKKNIKFQKHIQQIIRS
ncbi:tetratricopeptide repeat protein [Chryseobacterium soli]|uniref:tetratricopeptide repeat protein n=1 Tax=Chryseobacterium soli TaxID=445961 RepID=UPI002954FD9C|nr:tetratricopeptide repeat protein [Chryseobacterium soli]MDV7697181.1 tetratricopeptide repeat protein [Chryseobacterium soli]